MNMNVLIIWKQDDISWHCTYAESAVLKRHFSGFIRDQWDVFTVC